MDSIVGHELLSFLDAYKGYHQIQMEEHDMAKMAFVTDDGIYCYTRIPFGFKNAGENFQESMNKEFEGFIWQIVKLMF